MTWHKEIWTYLIVTLVAVLIWAWAASETRERKTVPSAKVQFIVAGEQGEWLIKPADVQASLSIDGTKISVQKLTELLRKPLRIPIVGKAGHTALDLAAALRLVDEVAHTGAAIVATDPEIVELDMDQIEHIRVRVSPSLPGITPEGEVVVQPAMVLVNLPRSVQQRLPPDPFVEAFAERSELDRLEPGVPRTLDMQLRFPETLAVGPDAKIVPSKAKVSFTVRSRIRETTIDSVRVQLAGPPEDHDAYIVEVDPKVLRNVTLLADADLSRQIEAGDVKVIALVQLSSTEKESLIDHKPVSLFMALTPDGSGGLRYQQLNLKPGATMPAINIKITPRTPTQ